MIALSIKQDLAADTFDRGFNCAQAVFTAFCGDYGINRETALKTAGGFGGGVRSGEICGAASGGAMVVGLKHGQTVEGDIETKNNCGAKTVEFIQAFKKANNGALTCRDILGIDISSKENNALAREKGLFKTVCPCVVKDAVRILEELGY